MLSESRILFPSFSLLVLCHLHVCSDIAAHVLPRIRSSVCFRPDTIARKWAPFKVNRSADSRYRRVKYNDYSHLYRSCCWSSRPRHIEWGRNTIHMTLKESSRDLDYVFSNSVTTIFPSGSTANKNEPVGSKRRQSIKGLSCLQRECGKISASSGL